MVDPDRRRRAATSATALAVTALGALVADRHPPADRLDGVGRGGPESPASRVDDDQRRGSSEQQDVGDVAPVQHGECREQQDRERRLREQGAQASG